LEIGNDFKLAPLASIELFEHARILTAKIEPCLAATKRTAA